MRSTQTITMTARPFQQAVVLLLTSLILLFAYAQTAYAETIIATGTITDQDGAALQNVQLDCLTGENNNGANALATSGADGSYTCSVDGTLTNGTPVSIQPRSFPGYTSPQQQNFTWSGTTQTLNFQYQSASKTINIDVLYEDGENVAGVQVTAQPINIEPGESASQVQEDLQGGTGDLSVTGGDWIVKADANFSETNAESYPWISITQPIKVSFADDSVIESVDLEFIVAKSAQKVSVTLKDADGATLNGGSVGDAYFEGYSGRYGSMSTSRKVNPTTGISELYLLPGVWTVSALDLQLSNQSFSKEDATFVIPDEAGTYDLGTIQATENQGIINGVITIGGEPATTIEVAATHIENGTRIIANSNSEGVFVLNNLAFGTYSITVSQDGYIPTRSATATISEDAMTVDDVVVEAESADTTVKGSILDEAGNVLTNVPGNVVVRSEDITFTAPVAEDGSFELEMYTEGLLDDVMLLEFIPQSGAEVFVPEPVIVPVELNSTFEADLVTSSEEATISGNIISFAGEALTSAEFGEKATVMAIEAETGAVETASIENDGSFELMVGPGDWTIVPQLHNLDAAVATANRSSTDVTVEAGQETTAEVSMMEEVGTAEVTVTDPDGEAVPEAPVMFTNLPALQAVADESGQPLDQSKVVQVSATADAEGVVSVGLPEGTFTATFGTNPEVNAFAEPQILEFAIEEGDIVTLEGAYSEAAGSVEGSVGSGFESASITFYSSDGGTETMSIAKDGTYSGAISSGEWNVIVTGVKDGEFYVEEQSITVKNGDNSFDLSLEATGLPFPTAVTMSGNADEQLIVSNTDGAAVSIPAYGAAFSGTITATLQPVIEFGNTGDMSQVGLSYEVNVVDEDGASITTLNTPATVTLPLPEELIAGVDAAEMTASYYHPDMESFLTDGMVASTNGSMMVIQTKHFSRFAVTTTGDGEIAPEPVKAKTLKAKKIKRTSAVISWKKPANSDVSRYVLQIRKKGVTKKAWMKYTKITKLKKKVVGLKTNTRYQMRVKACNADLCSDFTKWKKFRTKI